MSVKNFIPALWSARLIEFLRKNLVYVNLCNRNWEGEIKAYGDTVKIGQIGIPTVKDYTKNQDIDDAEDVDGTQQLLVIDQQKYFNVSIDDVDNAQTNPKLLNQFGSNASYALADVADKHVAKAYLQASSTNLIGTDASPVALTPALAYEVLVDAGVKMDEANVPKQGRYVVVPPWFVGLILKDPRFIGTGSQTADQVLYNGQVGHAAGFVVCMSNNVPNVSGQKYKIMAGIEDTMTFADQVIEMEAYRPQKRFADAIKGLHVYGHKVTRPDTMVVITANRS